MTIAIAAAVAAGCVIGWWLLIHFTGLGIAYAVGALAVGGAAALSRLIATGHV